MKRSGINKALKELESMCTAHRRYLPPFCQFTPEQWQSVSRFSTIEEDVPLPPALQRVSHRKIKGGNCYD